MFLAKVREYVLSQTDGRAGWRNRKKYSGFSLLELLLVLAILAVIIGITAGSYGRYQRTVELDEEANRMYGTLQRARGNAVALEQGYAWGIRFDNTSAQAPFFALFSGTSYTGSGTTSVYYLPASVEFEDPSAGNASEIIFSKRAGTTTAATTTIRLITNTGARKNLVISAQGLIKRE